MQFDQLKRRESANTPIIWKRPLPAGVVVKPTQRLRL
jgi:hypothetical protein